MMPRDGEVKYNWDAGTVAFTLTAMSQTMRCAAIVVDAGAVRGQDRGDVTPVFHPAATKDQPLF
jgi:hypothetical protein